MRLGSVAEAQIELRAAARERVALQRNSCELQRDIGIGAREKHHVYQRCRVGAAFAG